MLLYFCPSHPSLTSSKQFDQNESSLLSSFGHELRTLITLIDEMLIRVEPTWSFFVLKMLYVHTEIATASSASFAQDILRPSLRLISHFLFIIWETWNQNWLVFPSNFFVFLSTHFHEKTFYRSRIFINNIEYRVKFQEKSRSLPRQRAKIRRPKKSLSTQFEILVKKWRPSSCKNWAGANESS